MSTSDVALMQLATEAASILGVPRRDAIEAGLRLIVSIGKSGVEGISAGNILSSADSLSQDIGAFTMDDLLDHSFGDSPIFSPHKVKIYAAKVLRASGFTRRQFRRGSDRPLLWLRNTEAL